MPGIEGYAILHKRLHPEVVQYIRPEFPDKTLNAVRISIWPKDWVIFRLSWRGSPTPAFVTGKTIFLAENFLNKPGRTYGNTMDLTTEEGWETLLHEIVHVHQFVSRGWWWMTCVDAGSSGHLLVV